MNIIRISKNLFIIDGVLLRFELGDPKGSCQGCYYEGHECVTNGYVLCIYLEEVASHDPYRLSLFNPSLILSSKIRNEYNKNK